MANPAAPYSILNPETISDSPSAKSKGARFVSATILQIHIKNTGRNKNKSQYFIILSVSNLILLTIKIGNNKIKIILTSYEIV